jgi:hypothetical protein
MKQQQAGAQKPRPTPKQTREEKDLGLAHS